MQTLRNRVYLLTGTTSASYMSRTCDFRKLIDSRKERQMRTALITAAVAAGVLVAPGAIALDHTSSAGQRGPAASARTVGESFELTRFTAWASGTAFAATPNSLVAAGVRTPIVAFIGGGGRSGCENGLHTSRFGECVTT